MNERTQQEMAVHNTAIEICKKIQQFDNSKDYLEMLNPGKDATPKQDDEFNEQLRQFLFDVGQKIMQHIDYVRHMDIKGLHTENFIRRKS